MSNESAIRREVGAIARERMHSHALMRWPGLPNSVRKREPAPSTGICAARSP